eukprot:TRINITY_DN14833_c0_g2_i6.p1 TRINITY_DN14833_c0_g2~~TRINITY_DN14833_c0_g2_i6.p1  ORF type:complete len:1056 (-),score=269.67 TRINITY_DN14833_c0_g2_i6:177-3344(-)
MMLRAALSLEGLYRGFLKSPSLPTPPTLPLVVLAFSLYASLASASVLWNFLVMFVSLTSAVFAGAIVVECFDPAGGPEDEQNAAEKEKNASDEEDHEGQPTEQTNSSLGKKKKKKAAKPTEVSLPEPVAEPAQDQSAEVIKQLLERADEMEKKLNQGGTQPSSPRPEEKQTLEVLTQLMEKMAKIEQRLDGIDNQPSPVEPLASAETPAAAEAESKPASKKEFKSQSLGQQKPPTPPRKPNQAPATKPLKDPVRSFVPASSVKQQLLSPVLESSKSPAAVDSNPCKLPFDPDDDDEEEMAIDPRAASLSSSLSMSARKLLLKHHEEQVIQQTQVPSTSLSLSARKLLLKQSPSASQSELPTERVLPKAVDDSRMSEPGPRMSEPGPQPVQSNASHGVSAGSLEGLSNVLVRQAATARLQGLQEPSALPGPDESQSLYKIPLEHFAISWPTSNFELRNVLKNAISTANQKKSPDKKAVEELPGGVDRAPGGPLSGGGSPRSRSGSGSGANSSNSSQEWAPTVSFDLPIEIVSPSTIKQISADLKEPSGQAAPTIQEPDCRPPKMQPVSPRQTDHHTSPGGPRAGSHSPQGSPPMGGSKSRNRNHGRRGGKQDPRIANATARIKQLAQKKDLKGAIREMESAERMADPSDRTALVGLYNSLVGASIRCGNLEYARQVVTRMSESGFPPNSATYNAMISGCGKLSSVAEAFRTREEMKAKALPADVVTYNALIDACVRANDLQRATKTLSEMEGSDISPNHITYSTLINGWAKAFNLDMAFKTLIKMQEAGIKPNQVTYTSLIDACMRSEDFPRVAEVLDEMHRQNIEVNVFTFNTIISGCARNGMMQEARHFFDAMRKTNIQPNHFSYNALISACARAGSIDDAFKAKQEMAAAGLVPDLCTANTLIKGCIQASNLDAAFGLLSDMKRDGITPDHITFTQLIDGCGQLHRMDLTPQVLQVLQSHPGPLPAPTVSRPAVHVRSWPQARLDHAVVLGQEVWCGSEPGWCSAVALPAPRTPERQARPVHDGAADGVLHGVWDGCPLPATWGVSHLSLIHI